MIIITSSHSCVVINQIVNKLDLDHVINNQGNPESVHVQPLQNSRINVALSSDAKYHSLAAFGNRMVAATYVHVVYSSNRREANTEHRTLYHRKTVNLCGFFFQIEIMGDRLTD